MFGFKKNKKEEADNLPPSDPATEQALKEVKEEESSPEQPKKKKRSFPLKKLIIMFVVALLLAGIGLAVFHFFFQEKNTAAVYPEKELPHVNLPEEMLKFCFYETPDIYGYMIEYNESIQLLDQEIQRITAVEQKYPDQTRITNKEKKVWEKSKTTLVKSFSKVQKKIRELYVLFQVNAQEGRRIIDEQKEGLSKEASEFLSPAKEQLMKLESNTNEDIPDGFFSKQVYKIKKKFL